MSAFEQLTDLLNAAQSGDSGAADVAYGIVYEELRERAGQSLRRDARRNADADSARA